MKVLTFLSAFKGDGKFTTSEYEHRHACLPARMEQLCSH
jgi:hypothetical protein